MAEHTPLTQQLIRDGLKPRRNRLPCDFTRRVSVAASYAAEGALHTAAERLEHLAADLRAVAQGSETGAAA